MSVQLNKLNADEFIKKFKAIRTQKGRRGIKLERLFWDVLKKISTDANLTMGSLVESTETKYPEQENLTSTLRVICLSEINDQLTQLQRITSDRLTKNLVLACPTPALALSSDKRLVSFNKPFLQFVHEKFSVRQDQELFSKLKLVLDVQIDVLIQRFIENNNQPIQVGIAIGVDERRIRSRMNVLLAPSAKQNLIIGYLIQ